MIDDAIQRKARDKKEHKICAMEDTEVSSFVWYIYTCRSYQESIVLMV